MVACIGLSLAELRAQNQIVIDEGERLFNKWHIRPLDRSLYFSERLLRDSTYTYFRDQQAIGSEEEAQDTEEEEVWILESRSVYEYDPRGLPIRELRSARDKDEWRNDQLISYNYDLGNTLSELREARWDSVSQDWLNSKQELYYYTYSGALREVIEQSWEMPGRWDYSQRIAYDYYDDDLLQRLTVFGWSLDELLWMPEERLTFTYEEDSDLLTVELLQRWDDSLQTWLNYSKRTFAYDDDDLLIETVNSTWDKANQSFTTEVIVNWNYNEDGKPIRNDVVVFNQEDLKNYTTESAVYSDEGVVDMTFERQWDEDTESWEYFRYSEHFWSTYLLGNPEQDAAEISCRFQNPYTLGTPIFCQSLKPDLLYDLELYDIYGRRFYSAKVYGGQVFRLQGAIPRGMYILSIRGGLDAHSEKLIIR